MYAYALVLPRGPRDVGGIMGQIGVGRAGATGSLKDDWACTVSAALRPPLSSAVASHGPVPHAGPSRHRQAAAFLVDPGCCCWSGRAPFFFISRAWRSLFPGRNNLVTS